MGVHREANAHMEQWLPYALEIFEPREQRDTRQMLERLATMERITPFMLNQPRDVQQRAFRALSTPDAGPVRGLWNRVFGREQNRPPLFYPGEKEMLATGWGDPEGYGPPNVSKEPVYFTEDFSKYFPRQGAVEEYRKRVGKMGLNPAEASRTVNEFELGAGKQFEPSVEELGAKADELGLTGEDRRNYIASGGKLQVDRMEWDANDRAAWDDLMLYAKTHPGAQWSDILTYGTSRGMSKRVLGQAQAISTAKNYESLFKTRDAGVDLNQKKYELAVSRNKWQEDVARARLLISRARNQTELFKAYAFLRQATNTYVATNNDIYKWQVQNGQTPTVELMNPIPEDIDAMKDLAHTLLGNFQGQVNAPPPPPSSGGGVETPPPVRGRTTPPPLQPKLGFDLPLPPDKVYKQHQKNFVW